MLFLIKTGKIRIHCGHDSSIISITFTSTPTLLKNDANSIPILAAADNNERFRQFRYLQNFAVRDDLRLSTPGIGGIKAEEPSQ